MSTLFNSVYHRGLNSHLNNWKRPLDELSATSFNVASNSPTRYGLQINFIKYKTMEYICAYLDSANMEAHVKLQDPNWNRIAVWGLWVVSEWKEHYS